MESTSIRTRLKIAREYFGLNAEVRSIDELGSLDVRFDMVLLSHVLEHVEDPLQFLLTVSTLFTPTGVLVIELPNRNYNRQRYALPAGTLGWGEYPPHHLSFWSTRALIKTLELAGYTVLECRPRPYPENYQTQHTLTHRYGWPDNTLTGLVTRGLQTAGRICGLQGATINAIARRSGARTRGEVARVKTVD